MEAAEEKRGEDMVLRHAFGGWMPLVGALSRTDTAHSTHASRDAPRHSTHRKDGAAVNWVQTIATLDAPTRCDGKREGQQFRLLEAWV